MTEQVMGVVSAEVDEVNQTITHTGTLGAETSAASPKRRRIKWRIQDTTGQVHFIEERPKTLAERISEAYRDELEPKEKELLDHAAEQFGRRLSNEE